MIGRRRFLHCSLCASGGVLLGCRGTVAIDAGADAACDDAFSGGTRLGVMSFVGEDIALETRIGEGWDGRLYADLSRIDGEPAPSERHYLRTFFPDLLDPALPWRIDVSGLVGAPVRLTLDDLLALEVDQGVQVLECSGNARRGGFGLLSAAAWAGAPLRAVLERASVRPEATQVLVSGFDEHSVPSEGGHSTPGASWIFGLDELERAFLATRMNGEPLPPDHGAPVRLFVPGWYGCTCIKWVRELRLVGDDEPATSQMIEFASRTHQSGAPALARDFMPATLDAAAMPVRIEKWRVGGAILYRVIGLVWGGSTPVAALSFDDGASRAAVEVCPAPTPSSSWTTWQHAWAPASVGDHAVRMRIDDPSIRTRRLDAGYYERVVHIDEV